MLRRKDQAISAPFDNLPLSRPPFPLTIVGSSSKVLRLVICFKLLFQPSLKFYWTKPIASALKLHPSLDLAFMYELVNVLWRVSEESGCLAYTPRAVFMFKFVIRIHIFPFLYLGVRFHSAVRNLPTLFASSVVDTAANATTRHSDEQEKTICEFGDLAAVFISSDH